MPAHRQSRRLTVITVSYNVRDHLKRCLEIILPELDALSAQMIVVDNDSRDGTAEMIRALFPGVKLIALSGNEGFACANNRGLQQTDTDYVFFLNPDTLPIKGLPETLLTALDSHPDAAAAGPRPYWDTGKRFLISCLKTPSPRICWLAHSSLSRLAVFDSWLEASWKTDWEYWSATSGISRVPAIGGAYMMVRKSALDAVGGGFDPAYFLGYEDVDLSLTFRKKGYSLLFVPEAEVIHLYGASKRNAPEEALHCRHWRKGPGLYLTHHYGRSSASLAGNLLALEEKLRPSKTAFMRSLPSEKPTRASSIHLQWNPVHSGNYLVELATSPSFLDKLGTFTPIPELTVESDLLDRLSPGKYFYRVFAVPPQPKKTIARGSFLV